MLRTVFWISGTGKDLRGDHEARELALYLISSPTSNLIGLYYLPLSVIAHELGMTLEGAREALARVCVTGFAQYDERAEHVWVVNMAREQVGNEPKKADNRIAGVRKELLRREKSPFYDSFCDRYETLFGVALRRVPLVAAPPPKGLERGLVGAAELGDRDREGEGEENRADARPPPKAPRAAERPNSSRLDRPVPKTANTGLGQEVFEMYRAAAFARGRTPESAGPDQKVRIAQRVCDHASLRGLELKPACDAIINQAFDDAAATDGKVVLALERCEPGTPAQPRFSKPGGSINGSPLGPSGIVPRPVFDPMDSGK